VELPDTRYARARDGAYIAYEVFGEGPVDLFWQHDSFAMVESWRESPPDRALNEGLSEFARVIVYDRRGTGLSSRDRGPGNLETQAADVLAVLDAVGSERFYLGGLLESCAPNVLLAATYPEGVEGLVWVWPMPRVLRAPDYPWGADAEWVQRDLELTERWGTVEWVHAFADMNPDVMKGLWGSEDYLRFIARVARRTCTPDVARGLSEIWGETDVRGILPAVRAPVLLVDSEDDPEDRALTSYMASLLPHSETFFLPWPVNEVKDLAPLLGAIERFVGGEPQRRALDRVLATVLFTDIVGSTEHLAELGDSAWRRLLADHDARAKAEIERFRGTYVASTGDGLFARFDGPARAVLCARSIGEALRPLGLRVRAGLHTGEVELQGDEVRGIAVHIGARVAATAGADEIWVSSTVKDLTAGSGLTFDDAGEHELKGVPDRWHLYRVVS
jgi:class 3 adenylate cyclase/pimeloyl-ACP methyl ester carboxylesterase